VDLVHCHTVFIFLVGGGGHLSLDSIQLRTTPYAISQLRLYVVFI
jgi:hypothetical protein